ncbi:GNAT family N-acetyltransferase [Kocuria rosea]|uniref:GNAT family N-acetyltransferase n=1 Tax=Kocuria rosea TaxID=1275 RepID=UPI001FCF9218|nr:GNAT family N-acetyltransferase [Kocuria rosea]
MTSTPPPMDGVVEPVGQHLLPGDTVGAITVVGLQECHWPAVREIYAAGIATGQATFESRPPDWEAFTGGKPEHLRQVAVDEHGAVLGWVAAAPVSARQVYAGVVEESVYVHPDAAGHGVGRLLLQALIAAAEAAEIWTIEAKIFPENTASLALHQKLGFEPVGVRRRLGRMSHGPHAGQWRDVILLERRSDNIGI